MKREFSPVYLALFLVVFCVAFRVISSHYTDYTFDISPLMAVAYVGVMYLPRRWGWLIAPISLVFTELAFLRVNYLTDASGQYFSWWTVASVAFYAVLYASASGLGVFIARFRSLGLLIGGSLFASLVFYIASNTFSFAYDNVIHMPNGYAPTLAGWWQANTVGLPGYPATWHFLRNGALGDLLFAFILLLMFDRALLFGRATAGDGAATGLSWLMPPVALSTAWNSYRHQDGYAMLKEIRQLGFPVCELGHAIRFSLWPGIVKAWEEDLIRIQTLHNFCPVPTSIFRPDPNCYEFSDPRESQRVAAIKATEETIRQAARFGAKAVVMHLGSGGPYGITRKLKSIYRQGGFLNRAYTEAKLKAVKQRQESFKKLWPRVRQCLEPLVNFAGEHGIKLGFEIRQEFEEFPHEEEFPEILEAFSPEVVGYWHDFGHSQCKEFFGWHDHGETLALRKSRLLGAHIHDCRRPQEDHLPLGHGEIAFSSLLPLMPENAIGVLELAPGTPEEQVIASRHLWNSYVAASG